MLSEQKTRGGQVNKILLLVVGLLAGFIGGYAVARHGAPATGIASGALTGSTTCQWELDPADQDIIAGFICPSPQCTDPLAGCHCETAHQVKKRVKDLLAAGKTPDEVRAEIQAEYNL
jgi:hypothetical protein